jgi:hypothetical protein
MTTMGLRNGTTTCVRLHDLGAASLPFESPFDCHLIAGCPGAVNGLLAEVVEDHVRARAGGCRGLGVGDHRPSDRIIGAAVIANWSFGLIRDTGAVLLDMSPDHPPYLK